MKNEKTSASVAKLAGMVLANGKGVPGSFDVLTVPPQFTVAFQTILAASGRMCVRLCTASELGSVLASALTQTPDKPKRKK